MELYFLYSYNWLLSLMVIIFEVDPHCWCGLILCIVVWYPIVWMYCNVLSHSPVDGLLGCFHFEAIMNKAAVNIYVKFFV